MDKETRPKTRPLHMALVLVISFILFNLGFVIDQTIRWTDHFSGFINGIFHSLLFGIPWCFTLLPWSLIIYGLYRRFGWSRFRTYWILAPALFFSVITVEPIIRNPQTTAKRFSSLAKTELPADASNLQVQFTGGGVTDYGDTYYFKTSPLEIDRLISTMNLSLDESFDPSAPINFIGRLANAPDSRSWKDSRQYKKYDDCWFYYLITNSTKTEVYIFIGSI
jgi:hypothetical protein